MFSFIWSPQPHKTRGGYYINHDNLMLSSETDRNKLILYFIGCQTPEKLNPEDRKAFIEEKTAFVDSKALLFGLTSGLTGMFYTPRMASKYNRRNILNGLVFLAVGTLAFYVGSQACYLIMEPYFINTSKIVEDLSNKYKFRIYDFAQAKKESHLKELRNELTSESANLFY